MRNEGVQWNPVTKCFTQENTCSYLVILRPPMGKKTVHCLGLLVKCLTRPIAKSNFVKGLTIIANRFTAAAGSFSVHSGYLQVGRLP